MTNCLVVHCIDRWCRVDGDRKLFRLAKAGHPVISIARDNRYSCNNRRIGIIDRREARYITRAVIGKADT